MEDVDVFITNYSGGDLNKISFCQQNKSSNEWQDLNCDFRHAVCQKIFNEGREVSGLLLKDLFRSEAIYSREIWAESEYVSRLGAKLLIQTKDQYIEDYLIGKYESMDTDCAVSFGDAGEATLKEIVTNMKASAREFERVDFTKEETIASIEEYIERVSQTGRN